MLNGRNFQDISVADLVTAHGNNQLNGHALHLIFSRSTYYLLRTYELEHNARKLDCLPCTQNFETYAELIYRDFSSPLFDRVKHSKMYQSYWSQRREGACYFILFLVLDKYIVQLEAFIAAGYENGLNAAARSFRERLQMWSKKSEDEKLDTQLHEIVALYQGLLTEFVNSYSKQPATRLKACTDAMREGYKEIFDAFYPTVNQDEMMKFFKICIQEGQHDAIACLGRSVLNFMVPGVKHISRSLYFGHAGLAHYFATVVYPWKYTGEEERMTELQLDLSAERHDALRNRVLLNQNPAVFACAYDLYERADPTKKFFRMQLVLSSCSLLRDLVIKKRTDVLTVILSIDPEFLLERCDDKYPIMVHKLLFLISTYKPPAEFNQITLLAYAGLGKIEESLALARQHRIAIPQETALNDFKINKQALEFLERLNVENVVRAHSPATSLMMGLI